MDEFITIPADAIDDYQASPGRRGLRKRCGGEQRGKHGVAGCSRQLFGGWSIFAKLREPNTIPTRRRSLEVRLISPYDTRKDHLR